MLKDCGIFAGIIFTQLWSYKCQICGKKEDQCFCQKKELERKLNPHFHVVGFGYLKGIKEFREKYEDWVYVNLGRRTDGYHTTFYILTNVALWRKADGKLKPAYQSFGYLKSNKFAQIKEKVNFITDRCPTCKKPRKKVLSGVEVITSPRGIQDSILLLNRPEAQTPLIERLSSRESRELTKHTQSKAILLKVSETQLILGREMKYKQLVREFKLLDVEGLREITMKNKVQYRKDKKKWGRNEKEGNGYG